MLGKCGARAPPAARRAARPGVRGRFGGLGERLVEAERRARHLTRRDGRAGGDVVGACAFGRTSADARSGAREDIVPMQSVLIVIHLLVVIALVAVVLLQRSEGGALGAGGRRRLHDRTRAGQRAFARDRDSGALFFATALLMSVIAGWSRAPRSIIDTAAPATRRRPNAPPAQRQPARPAQADGRANRRRLRSGAAAPARRRAAPAPEAPK